MPDGNFNLDPIGAALNGAELPNADLFDPTVLEGKEYVTVFRHSSLLMTKRNYLGENGEQLQQAYGGGKHFRARVVPVAGLEDVAAIAEGLGPYEYIVPGRPIAGTDMQRCRRLSNDHPDEEDGRPTLEDGPRRHVVLDMDGADPYDSRGEFDPVADPERAVILLRSELLPYNFAGATCWWSLSSNAGWGESDGKIHMKLIFWCDRPTTLAEQKHWMRAYTKSKNNNPAMVLDAAVFKPAQPIYLAPPVFDPPAVDPVPRRSGILRGAHDVVQVPVFHDYEADREPASERPPGAERDTASVTLVHLKNTLRWIDPNRERNENDGWMAVVSAIANTRIVGDDDTARGAAIAAEKRRVAHAWMAGDFYRDWYEPPGAAKHRDPEEIDRVFDSAGVSFYDFRTIMRLAREGGYGAAAEGDAREPGAPRKLIKLVRLTEFFQRPDPVELVCGMIMEGENLSFVGTPKSGKSFIAIEIGMSIASGGKIVGHHEVRKHGPVVYLSGEGHAGMKRRLMCWCEQRGISPEEVAKLPFYYNEGVIPATAGAAELEAAISDIMETCGETPVLVILDTMSRSLGGSTRTPRRRPRSISQ